MDNLLKQLNDISRFSTASNISIGDLTVDERYKVVRLEKVEAKFGVAIVAYISRGREELSRIYLPKKFIGSFGDEFISKFNRCEVGDLFLTYKGVSQKSFNIVFS